VVSKDSPKISNLERFGGAEGLQQNLQDDGWIQSNLTALEQAYDGRWIAVLGGVVLAADQRLENLKKTLQSRKIDPNRVVFQRLRKRNVALQVI
jgi:hypothetical protein